MAAWMVLFTRRSSNCFPTSTVTRAELLKNTIRSLERASAYWSDNPRVFHNLAIAYWQSEKIDDAINAFLQAIRLQPTNPEFLQNLVQLLTQRGRWSEALPHARNMVRLLPDNPQAQAFLAQIEKNAQGQ